MKLNERALEALLSDRQGPIGRLVERKAAEIAEQARANARVIMHRAPPSTR